MALFFNGRLFVSPAVASRVDDTAMFNANPGVGNVLAVIGAADAGEPKVPLRFGTPAEAAAVLRGGPLLEHITRAFAGSLETPGPSLVIGVRAQAATQATLNLADAALATVVQLRSTLWGALANRIQVQIGAATVRGRRIRTSLDGVVHEADNVGRQLMVIRYTGAAASATVSISGAGVTLAAPTGSPLPVIPFADAPTVEALVERISLLPGWTATVLNGNETHPTADALDFAAAVDAKSADFTVTADLQAMVDWFNAEGEGLVTATRPANVGTLPVNTTGTYLTGGTTTAPVVQDFQDALTALQQQEVQWIVPATTDAAVHAMVRAHAHLCSDVLRKERRAICGTALNTSDAQAIQAARNLNSDRVGLVHIGGWDYDTAGRLRLYAPSVVAAMIAGGFAGVNPGTAMTNKALALQGVERRLRNPTDTDALLTGGVMPVEETPTGYRVTQSVSTWLTNSNFNRRELSVGAALDYVARAWREAMQPLIGGRGGPPALVQAKVRTEAVMRELSRPEPQGVGVLVGDAANPPWRKLRISLDGDTLRLEAEVSPVIPTNYIPITIAAVPYSGALAA